MRDGVFANLPLLSLIFPVWSHPSSIGGGFIFQTLDLPFFAAARIRRRPYTKQAALYVACLTCSSLHGSWSNITQPQPTDSLVLMEASGEVGHPLRGESTNDSATTSTSSSVHSGDPADRERRTSDHKGRFTSSSEQRRSRTLGVYDPPHRRSLSSSSLGGLEGEVDDGAPGRPGQRRSTAPDGVGPRFSSSAIISTRHGLRGVADQPSTIRASKARLSNPIHTKHGALTPCLLSEFRSTG